MSTKIYENHTLKEYEKKYSKIKSSLKVYSKEMVLQYDQKKNTVGQNLLLENKKWWLIEDTYYQVPKFGSSLWKKNLSGGAKAGMIISLVVVIGGVAGGVTYALWPKGNIKDDQGVKFITELNEDLKTHNELVTTFDVVKYYKEAKDIDLENVELENKNHEIAYDMGNKAFVVLNKDGTLFYSEKTMSQKSSVFRMMDSYTYNTTATSPTDIYGTYIKTKTPNLVTKSVNQDQLKINTSIDVGYNTQYDVKFDQETGYTGFKPIVVTNKNILDINGSLEAIDHYGVASYLLIEKLSGTYNEYGIIEGNVILKSEQTKFVAKENSVVNTIIVENGNSTTVECEKDSYVGTVATTLDISLESVVTKKEGAVVKEIKEEKIQEEDILFDGGFGTENSPYIIRTVESLNLLSEKVNGEGTHEDFCDKYYEIVKDIDLSTIENFTPIGSKERPFKGHFNGNGHTISNLKIKKETSNIALFGFTQGEPNTHFKNYDSVYDVEKDEVIYDNISEDKYTCIIKNLTLSNVEIDVVDIESNPKQAAGFIGLALNTRAENLSLTSGTIIGNKACGGIIGTMEDSILLNSSTEDGVVVKAKEYNNGGVVGCIAYDSNAGGQKNGVGVINCTNNARVIAMNEKTNESGYVGGVIGFISGHAYPKGSEGQNCWGHVVIGCYNYGVVSGNDADTTRIPESIGGVVGHGNAGPELIANCVNYGEIMNLSDSPVKRMAGVITSCQGHIINCSNGGNVTGNSKYKAGVICGQCNNGHYSFSITNCSNTGEVSTKGCTQVGNICAGIFDTPLKKMTFETTDEFVSAFKYKYIVADSETEWNYNINCSDITIKDPSGVLKIDDSVKSFTLSSDKKIFGSLSYPSTMETLNIDAPMGDVTLCNAPNLWLTLKSENSTFTIPEGATVKYVTLSGKGSKLINNGTITGGVILNDESYEFVNNGTVGHINVNGANDYSEEGTPTNKKIVNNGIVTTSSSHCISFSKYINCEFENYGEINAGATADATYLFLAHCNGEITITNYAGSKIKMDSKINGISQTTNNMHTTIKHQKASGGKDAASITKEGSSDYNWKNLSWTGHIDVVEID